MKIEMSNTLNGSGTSSDSGFLSGDGLFASNEINVSETTNVRFNNKDTTSVNLENTKTFRESPDTHANKKSTSPTSSTRSLSISIRSLRSDAESSVIPSDCEEFENSHPSCSTKTLGLKIQSPDGENILNQYSGIVHKENHLASTLAAPAGTQNANLSFNNSTDITIGSKYYCQGPVTIKQIVVEKPKQKAGTTKNRDTSKDNYCKLFSRYKNIFRSKVTIIAIFILILVIVVGVTLGALTNQKTKGTSWFDGKPAKDNGANTTIDIDSSESETGLVIVNREDWGAMSPREALVKLRLPVHRVIISHTVTESCTTKGTCSYLAGVVQKFLMNKRGFVDISYNFLVGGDGRVYVGRGWDYRGAHTKDNNNDSIGIAFIGDFELEIPPERQVVAAQLLIDDGVRLEKLVPDYRLYGARQLTETSSPGDALYEVMKKWPKWQDLSLSSWIPVK